MHGQTSAPKDREEPLISRRLMIRLAIALTVLLVATAGISVGGRLLGERMSLGGHSADPSSLEITIGEDTLSLPANTIRFADQRHAGKTDRIDLYLTWPRTQGYSEDLRDMFDNIERTDLLLFLQISQSTMSKDMSGRIGPIYSQLFDGKPTAFAHGLTLHRMRQDSGYGREVLLTAERAGETTYAVRCLLPAHDEAPTGGDCQRDIHIGQDLTVLYRFSSTLLKDWQHIDAAVASFVRRSLEARNGSKAAKMHHHQATSRSS